LAKQLRLGLGCFKVGARRLGIAGTIQMLGSQDRVVGENFSGGTMQFPLARVGERAVDAVTIAASAWIIKCRARRGHADRLGHRLGGFVAARNRMFSVLQRS
jgi:hypothetical protein